MSEDSQYFVELDPLLKADLQACLDAEGLTKWVEYIRPRNTFVMSNVVGDGTGKEAVMRAVECFRGKHGDRSIRVVDSLSDL
jgi:hypothetical protein